MTSATGAVIACHAVSFVDGDVEEGKWTRPSRMTGSSLKASA